MLHFNIIKNEELRQLAKLSESIHAMPEEEGKKMLASIALLSQEGQEAMIAALKEEQQAIETAKTVQIKQIKHNFETKVREIGEKRDMTKSDEVAEEALKEL